MHVKETERNTECTLRECNFRIPNMNAVQEHLKAQHGVTTISSGAADRSSLEFPRSQLQYFQETNQPEREGKGQK